MRLILADMLHGNRVPAVVMGDFNDVITATTTQLVMGSGQRDRESYDERLFDAQRIQRRTPRGKDVAFTDIHDGRHETIDHILVSEEFARIALRHRFSRRSAIFQRPCRAGSAVLPPIMGRSWLAYGCMAAITSGDNPPKLLW